MIDLRLEELEHFNNDPSYEKAIVFSMNNCEPCHQLKDFLAGFEKTEAVKGIKIYRLIVDDEAQKAGAMTEIGVKFYPTLFYFIEDSLAGRMQGLRSNASQETLVDWFVRRKRNVQDKAQKELANAG